MSEVMRAWLRSLTFFSILVLVSCGPQAALAPAASSTPAPTAIPHAAEIRFALIGNVSDVNVWALFDSKGQSYNNYAVMSAYWPRLYRLSIPDRTFETMAASAMPSSFQQEGSFYTATIPLRSDLKWTDGTPFTADDVAFTVNTALAFQLGFDWHDFYNPDFIDHAQAVDLHTVKFYFKKQPNVGVWQYGALQGPLVQKAYWSSKISASATLLPPGALAAQIENFSAQAANLQSRINALYLVIATSPANSDGQREAQNELKSRQDDLNQANNSLGKLQSAFDSAMTAARQRLYGLDHTSEPTLGDWMPAGQENGAWINKVNPAHPFNTPHFDGAAYETYISEDAAVKVFQNNGADAILESNGLSVYDYGLKGIGSLPIMKSPSHHLVFLVFNLSNQVLSDPALRQALACIADSQAMDNQTDGFGMPVRLNFSLTAFVAPGTIFWNNKAILFPCDGLDSASRFKQTVARLKSAGYRWLVEPTMGVDPKGGLYIPNGEKIPSLNFLVSSEDADAGLVEVFISLQMEGLGTFNNIQEASPDFINYSVFSSHQYDMAILGWRVSEYPGYLCDWFRDGNPFGYHSDRLQAACEALNSTSDLGTAQKQVIEIQSILTQDLPFIPLYSSITYDAYRNIRYPFSSMLGGLSGVYGAPSLAVPASQ